MEPKGDDGPLALVVVAVRDGSCFEPLILNEDESPSKLKRDFPVLVEASGFVGFPPTLGELVPLPKTKGLEGLATAPGDETGSFPTKPDSLFSVTYLFNTSTTGL